MPGQYGYKGVSDWSVEARNFWDKVAKLYDFATWPNPVNPHETANALAVVDRMMANMPYTYIPPHFKHHPGFIERYYRPSTEPTKKRGNSKFTWEQATEIRRKYDEAIKNPEFFRSSRTNPWDEYSTYMVWDNGWTIEDWAKRVAPIDLAHEYGTGLHTIIRILNYETYPDPEHVPGPPNVTAPEPDVTEPEITPEPAIVERMTDRLRECLGALKEKADSLDSRNVEKLGYGDYSELMDWSLNISNWVRNCPKAGAQ